MRLLPALALVASVAAIETLFPGPWERYIQAPSADRIVRASSISYTEGNINYPSRDHDNLTVILHGHGALVTFEFPQNTGGRLLFRVDEATTNFPQSVGIAFTESPEFIGRRTDSTTEENWDMTSFLPLKPGINGFDHDHTRGAFKYATFFIPAPSDPIEGQAYPCLDYTPPRKEGGGFPILKRGQKPIKKRPLELVIGISEVWVEFTAAPAMQNPRAYTGYFYSSDNLLNRIWYSGAYTLQLTTIPPHQGGSLIDFNKHVDNNKSPPGSWYSNYTISNGTSVTVDGAKRDRMVYAGDMTIAAPGIAVSTLELASIRNALQTLFDHHYETKYGAIMLPYAGPPMGENGHEFSDTYHLHALLGVHQYVLFSGDFDFLTRIWPLYVRAIEYALAHVSKESGLFFVTHSGDWLRPGMGGENIEAQGLLYKTLTTSITLSTWLPHPPSNIPTLQTLWRHHRSLLRAGVMAPNLLYNPTTHLFSDNPTNRRHIFPQDGNSIAIFSRLLPPSSPLLSSISSALAARWLPHGAPAPEAPSVISPFATAFELHAHALAGRLDRTLALIRLQWGHLLDGEGFTNSTLAEGYCVCGDHGYPLYRRRNRNSHAHGWSAGPTSVLMEYVLGIRLTGPMGKTWVAEPQIVDLEWVQGGFTTRLGTFEVEMRRGVEGLVVRIVTPRGTRGVVLIGGRRWDVLDGGEWVWVVGKDGGVESKGLKGVENSGMVVQM